MYAVFADYRFAGLFRSLAAARRWKAELETYPIDWWEPPCIEECSEESLFEHREGRRGRQDVLAAIERRHFGRRN